MQRRNGGSIPVEGRVFRILGRLTLSALFTIMDSNANTYIKMTLFIMRHYFLLR